MKINFWNSVQKSKPLMRLAFCLFIFLSALFGHLLCLFFFGFLCFSGCCFILWMVAFRKGKHWVQVSEKGFCRFVLYCSFVYSVHLPHTRTWCFQRPDYRHLWNITVKGFAFLAKPRDKRCIPWYQDSNKTGHRRQPAWCSVTGALGKETMKNTKRRCGFLRIPHRRL